MLKFKLEGNHIEVSNESKSYNIDVITEDIIHIFDNIGQYEFKKESTYKGKVEVDQKEDEIVIKLDKYVIEVKSNLFINILNLKGEELFSMVTPSDKVVNKVNLELLEAEGHKAEKSAESKPISFAHKLNEDDKIYALGERASFLDRRYYAYENWNTDDPTAHNEQYRALYKSVPFYIVFNSRFQYGIFFDNHFHTYFDLGKSYKDELKVEADGGNFNLFFIGGDTLKDIVTSYTSITGRTHLPQLFTLGHQQSRWSYMNEKEVLELAHNFRKYNIKCDVIHLDIDYMERYKVFTTSKESFPNFKEMVDSLHSSGFKVVTIIDPGTKVEKGYDTYEYLVNNKLCATLNGETYINEVWPGESIYPTFNKKETRDFWANEIKKLTDLGVDAIWDDMNEPASFKGPLPLDVDFAGTSHKEIHNLYGNFMAEATYDGLKKHTAKRPFVITRAAFSGTQKYSTIWTGDNQSLWHHLRANLPQLASLGLSGFAFAGSDLGGFGGDATPELLSRWVEAAIVYPLFRNHSAMGTIRQEPWVFDKKTTDIYRKFVDVRYELIPYIYDLFYKQTIDGIAPIRPLVLEYQEDENTYKLNDEVMLGSNILHAPVLDQGVDKRLVYLPKGKWYNYFTNEVLEGGYHIVDAPIDTLPLYVKEGSILPIGTYETHVELLDELVLKVYKGSSTYIHYQDDGESFDYEQGKYNLYEISHVDDDIKVKLLHEGYKRYKKITAYYEGKKIDIKL